MPDSTPLSSRSARQRVLWLSTIAFTLMFNVWLMLGVLGIPIRKSLNLTDTQLSWACLHYTQSNSWQIPD